MTYRAIILRTRFTKQSLEDFCEITGYDYNDIINAPDDKIFEMSESEFERWRNV